MELEDHLVNIPQRDPTMATEKPKVIKDATCTFCGCVCDDMELTVENNRITKAKNACVLGKAWFFNPETSFSGFGVF